jgi:hypothetical protein
VKSRVLQAFGKAANQAKVSVGDIAGHVDVLANEVKSGIQADLTAIGITLTSFIIESITLPPAIQKALEDAAAQAARGVDNTMAWEGMQAMRDVARNAHLGQGSGAMSAGMGLGMGMGMGNMMGQMMSPQQMGYPPPPGYGPPGYPPPQGYPPPGYPPPGAAKAQGRVRSGIADRAGVRREEGGAARLAVIARSGNYWFMGTKGLPRCLGPRAATDNFE